MFLLMTTSLIAARVARTLAGMTMIITDSSTHLADVRLLKHVMPNPTDGVQLGCTSKWTPSVHTSGWIRTRVLYGRGALIGWKRERYYTILSLYFAGFKTRPYFLVLFATGDLT
jgi:hypothetical protein